MDKHVAGFAGEEQRQVFRLLRNQDTYMEQVTISILASFLDADTKWSLFFGLSSHPIMPIAVKMLFSRPPLKEDARS
ncbi:hypothetical protein [Trichococcus patagoniensis]|uniref:hypothetical protein n=1 Tax=Trichococcus patagoniensis TaxID=382641 RepID=UPI001476683E|nr:hypothetical protein [Trichococcus patagoniensis]